MGIFGFGRRELVSVPSNIAQISVSALTVSTAESLVIISVNAETAAVLVKAARSRRPHLLVGDHSSVNLIPVKDARLSPAYDPDVGWIIPMLPGVSDSIVDLVSDGPGVYEIEGLNLAVVVD
ncbi:hypothetical protein [Corynebacterium alimapuense]|uniref:Uncharacterized protein n=1 Tax=Corynebacterium alimapuense TaxID=1576874 RepID=A0A3M8K7S2_9CORY|nr:hypothetical protein [Corynebacterium alimapuense]RNE48564.1 hypothetical protein C5L39_08730 [Corynebacterium alimapuense]